MISSVRTRFAPSPTGYLHIGGLRTALYSFLIARQNKGKFILRIEDTDRSRLVPDAQEKIAKTLRDLNLVYDEGFDRTGNFGPYLQSERLKIYQKYAQQLLEKGQAYYCFCSPERLLKLRKQQQKDKQPPKYDRACLNLSAQSVNEKLKQNLPHVVRLKIPKGKTNFTDLIRGEITINNESLDDQVLIKSDGYPTYHLAVVVDDHLMKISHVIRGEEWIPSTPKHIILFQNFGWQPPVFAHLPLLLNPDRSKLSKRQGDVAVEDFLSQGYLPEALLNYAALLGWNPGNDQEIFSLPDLIRKFDLSKVHKTGAVFDKKKLNWLNNYYLKKLNPTRLKQLAESYLPNKNLDPVKIINLFKDRLNNLSELAAQAEFLYQLPPYQPNLLIPRKSDKEITIKALNLASQYLNDYHQDWTAKSLAKYFDSQRVQSGLSRSTMFWPIRVALSGLDKSPDLFAIMEILGAGETANRLQLAIEKTSKM